MISTIFNLNGGDNNDSDDGGGGGKMPPAVRSTRSGSFGGASSGSRRQSRNNGHHNTNRRERKMALDALKQHASDTTNSNSDSKMWMNLCDKFRRDKEFVLTVLKTWRTLPSKTDFERTFPQSLRFDKDVVLAFCSRSDFKSIYYERHLYVPDCLTNDKSVMIAYCSKIPRSLQESSEELTDDRQVVEAALSLDGLELQYASLRLQEDPEIVRIACAKDGRALEFCPPGSVRDSLTSDRDFMLSVLRNNGGSMLRLVPNHSPLKHDSVLLLEALANGMRFRYCPYEYKTNKDFLLKALAKKSDIYLELMQHNKSLSQDIDLALAAVLASDSSPKVHSKALEKQPILSRNRQVALAIAKRGDTQFVKDFFINSSTTAGSSSSNGADTTSQEIYKDDKEIVLAILDKQPKLFTYASARLRQDTDCLLAAMDSDTALDVLKTCDSNKQSANPEIVIKAITVLNKRLLRNLRPHVQPESLWRDHIDIPIAWIKRGCRVLDTFSSLLNNQRLALEIAKHVWPDFARVSDDLKQDRDFMFDAIRQNGKVLRYASATLQSDYKLLVTAVATTADALWPTSSISKNQLQSYIDEKLGLFNTFMNDFLRGIAIHKHQSDVAPSRRSQLPLLDKGIETSQAFKRIIAEFVGVPIGQELRDMRTAHQHLQLPAPEPSAARTRSAAAADADNNDHDDGIELVGDFADLAERRFLRRRLIVRGHRAAAARAAAAGLGGGAADANANNADNDNDLMDVGVVNIRFNLDGPDNNDAGGEAPAMRRRLARLRDPFPFPPPGQGPAPLAEARARAAAALAPNLEAEAPAAPAAAAAAVPPRPEGRAALRPQRIIRNPLRHGNAPPIRPAAAARDLDDDLDLEEDMLFFMMGGRDAAAAAAANDALAAARPPHNHDDDDLDLWFDRLDRM